MKVSKFIPPILTLMVLNNNNLVDSHYCDTLRDSMLARCEMWRGNPTWYSGCVSSAWATYWICLASA